MTESAPDLDESTAINSLYMLICTCILPLIILGIALFYSGLTQRRSSFTMLSVPFLISPIVFIDWFIWGYSLCYASSGNRFIGSLNFAVLRHLRDPKALIYSTPRGQILSINHFLFNGLMKLICTAVTFPGCIAERGRILPMLVFLFFWSCIIYNPVTYWFWNRNGWLSTELGLVPVLDFAGGNCIHVVSGFTALAYSYILGPRNPKILYDYRSSNFGYVVIGMFFITCGWCAFIGGCDFKFSTLSIYIFVNTILSAFTCGIVWMCIDYYYSAIPLEGEIDIGQVDTSSTRDDTKTSKTKSSLPQSKLRRKLSMNLFASGIITGLVVQTPAGGYVSTPVEFWKPFLFGAIGAVSCNFATRLKYFFRIDDALDLFAIHGVAGIVGSLLVGIFANEEYGSEGGWVHGHWIQFGYQLAGCVVTAAYVFVMSLVFLYIIDYIPGLHLRIDKDFNKRVRDSERSNNRDNQEEGVDMESQVSPTQIADSEEGKAYEQAEIMGTDWYEFNAEFTLDFMEFIKVLKPADYNEDIELIEDSGFNVMSSNYLSEDGIHYRKRQ